jgi:hypothetical protein
MTRRCTWVGSRLLGTSIVLTVATALGLAGTVETQAPEGIQSVRSYPKDGSPYARPAEEGERSRSRVHPKVFLSDTIVSNTDPTLTNTDTFNDGELSIAINPANHDEIALTSFGGSWGVNAPVFHSLDGGVTWTKRFTIARPPGIPATGCPCDQTIDWGRYNLLSGAFLTVPTNVYSGTSFDLTNPAAFNWFVLGGVTQRTNQVAVNIADQPWLLVNNDPQNSEQDNVYVAYDDFSTGPDMRVAVSYGANPPVFATDVRSGISTGFVNPGHRLAENANTGAMYSLWQRRIAPGAGGSNRIDYMLNQSVDGGQSWRLGGSTGIIVATADSTQPWPKFGAVNALLGGVLHAATHRTTGALYYVYGNRDAATGMDRLALRRVTIDDAGTVTIGSESFVTGQVEAALPSVAVTPNGTVGVFYYTFDGNSATGFPIFTAHIAISEDDGTTFIDTPLLTFQSSARPSGNLFDRQRVLGDYMQLKVAGGTFYGGFTGNGVAFGRPFANHDPIFFKVQATGPAPR